jgi:hypothetical protein
VNVLDVCVPFAVVQIQVPAGKRNSAMVLLQLVAVGTDTLVTFVEFLPLLRDAVPSLAGSASMWGICINSQYNFYLYINAGC